MTDHEPEHPEPWTSESQAQEYADLLADRETLARVSEELVETRLALRLATAGLSPRVRTSLANGADWVKISRSGALALLNAIDRMGTNR